MPQVFAASPPESSQGLDASYKIYYRYIYQFRRCDGAKKLRLTAFTDYRLRVLIFLATEPDRRATIREIARAPRSINIGRVVRATEGAPLPAECFDRENGHCVITPVCKLRGVLREAVKSFYAVLDRYTLEDLVHNRVALAGLLFAGEATPPRRVVLRKAARH